MRTKTINLYSFAELSEEAKEKAVSHLRDINVDHNWWEYVYEDAKNVGLKINGFDIYRGSYCQLDIDHYYHTASRIVTDHGKDCDTYKAAEQFIADWDALVEKYSDGINTNVVTGENQYDFDSEADDLDEEFKKELSECYLTILRNQYEYLTSTESIIETIEANEYEFTEDGELI